MNEAPGLRKDGPRIEVHRDAIGLARHAAETIWTGLQIGLGAGTASFVATGGSTPIATYQELVRLPSGDEAARIRITLSDERWVAPDSADSNEGMLRASLLRGPFEAAAFTPLWRPEPSPEAAAAKAEADIAALAPFDVVLLGMGDDGHFASLFPGSPALAQGLDPKGPRLCIAAPAGSPAPPQPRISLTLRALLSSKLVVLLTSGAAKKPVLEAALDGADLPVRALLWQEQVPVRILWSP